MKLLASVLSVAAADYACCPYDEYGVPEPNCAGVLTEKSPFAVATGALVAEESYACKAWEANAGAALENHKASDTANAVHDWGSCGYQRHFPWYNKRPDAAGDSLVKIGLFGATGTFDPLYKVFGVGGNFGASGANWNMLSLTKGSFSGQAEGTMPITGEVHLGGVCKLFVPVQKEHIKQVSIAGVHINNARIVNGVSYANSAEMNAVVVGGFTEAATAADSWTGKYHAGTAYCFSVVNIAEFMTNRANNIANANVAGTDTRTAADSIWYADDQGLQYKNNSPLTGSSVPAQFGTIWPGYDSTTVPDDGTAGQKNSGQHKVNMGSNFDVVVHFDSAWCSAHWELIDMQKAGDHGEGTGTDSAGENLKGFENQGGGASEAKMDAWDKRLPVSTGSCGLCKDVSGVSRSPSIAAVGSDCRANTWTAGAAGLVHNMGTGEDFDYHGGTADPTNCVNLNSYASTASNRWPNAGAWAAFYSFVTCARSDYMIYGVATRTFRTVTLSNVVADHLDENGPTGAIAGPQSAMESTKSTNPADLKLNNDNRMVVVGGWHQDYRHGQGACVRFNLRQVGEHIKYCADGDEEMYNSKTAGDSLYKNPTGDTMLWSQNKPERCTWNWNYNQVTSNYDAEAWFDSIDPLHMQVWASGAVKQSDAEMFIDEPAPGSTATGGFKAAVAASADTLTDSVVINVLMQERHSTGAFVKPNTLVMDSDYASASTPTEFSSLVAPPADFPRFDTTRSGCTSKITLACKTPSPAKYNGGASGAERMRDNFPDCFFGDEIHGQWQWDTPTGILKDVDSAANTAVWRFYAMLHSHTV